MYDGKFRIGQSCVYVGFGLCRTADSIVASHSLSLQSIGISPLIDSRSPSRLLAIRGGGDRQLDVVHLFSIITIVVVVRVLCVRRVDEQRKAFVFPPLLCSCPVSSSCRHRKTLINYRNRVCNCTKTVAPPCV